MVDDNKRPLPAPRVIDSLRMYIREYWILSPEQRQDGDMVAYVARRFVRDGWWFGIWENPPHPAEGLASILRDIMREKWEAGGGGMSDVQATVSAELEARGFRKL